jgi:hypothetical protein
MLCCIAQAAVVLCLFCCSVLGLVSDSPLRVLWSSAQAVAQLAGRQLSTAADPAFQALSVTLMCHLYPGDAAVDDGSAWHKTLTARQTSAVAGWVPPSK